MGNANALLESLPLGAFRVPGIAAGSDPITTTLCCDGCKPSLEMGHRNGLQRGQRKGFSEAPVGESSISSGAYCCTDPIVSVQCEPIEQAVIGGRMPGYCRPRALVPDGQLHEVLG